ncbi:MAG: lysine--tRNA ligase [Solirubrobacterales bacterium]
MSEPSGPDPQNSEPSGPDPRSGEPSGPDPQNSEPSGPDPGEPGPSDLLGERRAKLERLRAEGIEPFPHEFGDREEIGEVRSAHVGLSPGVETESRHRVAGRLIARRGHGKAAFLDLRDASGQIQLHAREDVLGPEAFELLVHLDLGDIVGVEGRAFATRRGELSLEVSEWKLLAKSLRPPPDKFHGLEDTETRYRRRELDLIANEESRRLFAVRAATVSEVRRWLDDHGFVEVETPVLQPLYGGALARPFTTHHNALDRDLYLRIATELYLKRCVVGGMDRVYELGRDFRNEGISQKHNPEFTMLEWYEAYADYGKTAHDLELLVAEVAERVLGTAVIERGGRRIDLSPPWRRETLREAILERTGIDVAEHPSREALAEAMDAEPDPHEGWGKLVDGLLSRSVEPELLEPTFITDYPVELSPFAKSHRSEPGLVERWEAFVGGIEIANSFSELNDPDEQRRRFEMQAEELRRGDEEAQPYDESFVEALEQGMPPTGGVGLGIDRLVMLLTGARTLREVLLFPAMR